MARKPQENPKAEMTPMIDVVFQLMIFFVVTIKQEDIFSKLNANRPAPNQSSSSSESNDTQIKIDIGFSGLIFNGRGVRMSELKSNLKQLSGTSKNATVLIRCTMDSPHGKLVDVLDACNQYGMHNLSIFSM
ncbi:MAG: biopolymer transporter ExbD [Kiritimatiellae bacterium]|nr:biopolymer transporter ExbD [Kiritimatiellia bacterium]